MALATQTPIMPPRWQQIAVEGPRTLLDFCYYKVNHKRVTTSSYFNRGVFWSTTTVGYSPVFQGLEERLLIITDIIFLAFGSVSDIQVSALHRSPYIFLIKKNDGVGSINLILHIRKLKLKKSK